MDWEVFGWYVVLTVCLAISITIGNLITYKIMCSEKSMKTLMKKMFKIGMKLEKKFTKELESQTEKEK